MSFIDLNNARNLRMPSGVIKFSDPLLLAVWQNVTLLFYSLLLLFYLVILFNFPSYLMKSKQIKCITWKLFLFCHNLFLPKMYVYTNNYDLIMLSYNVCVSCSCVKLSSWFALRVSRLKKSLLLLPLPQPRAKSEGKMSLLYIDLNKMLPELTLANKFR